jgi:hypothetical protein
MDTNKLNGWLTLAGNMAILAGLILLVVEIRQNSDLMRAQISMERSTVSRQTRVEIANGGDFIPIVVKLRNKGDGFPRAIGWSDILTTEEHHRYRYWMLARAIELDNDWYLCKIDLVPVSVCQREVQSRIRNNMHRFFEMGITFNRSDPEYLAELRLIARELDLPEIGDDGLWKN